MSFDIKQLYFTNDNTYIIGVVGAYLIEMKCIILGLPEFAISVETDLRRIIAQF